MTFSQLFAFRDWGLRMIWNAHTKTQTEPLIDERERAMGSYIGTTANPDLSKGQRRFVLGQTMDLHTMVWTVRLCIALQRHRNDHFLCLEVEDLGQEAHRSTSMEERIEFVVGEAEQISRFK
jgi:hypothetical protein